MKIRHHEVAKRPRGLLFRAGRKSRFLASLGMTGRGALALLVMTTCLVMTAVGTLQAQDKPWSVRVVESVMRRAPVVYEKWDYTAGFVLLGLERVGATTRDPKYAAYIKKSVDSLVRPDGSILTYKESEYNLDQINQGRALFALADRTRDPRYMRAADALRQQLRTHPRTAEGGFWHKQIYPQQMWLDGLYMAEPFYAQYSVRKGDTASLNDITKQFLLIARHLRDPKTGLYYHAWDSSKQQKWADSTTGLSKNFWGRAVGWYLMAIMDVLDYLPKTHRDRAELIRVAQDLAEAVADVRDPVTGLWWQVLDQPNRAKNYLEASASAMFVYSFAKGARLGYLAPSYRALADRAFDSMLTTFVITNEDGTISIGGICKVAGLGGNPYRDGTYEYYVSEPVAVDDYKGVGAFILAAHELGR